VEVDREIKFLMDKITPFMKQFVHEQIQKSSAERAEKERKKSVLVSEISKSPYQFTHVFTENEIIKKCSIDTTHYLRILQGIGIFCFDFERDKWVPIAENNRILSAMAQAKYIYERNTNECKEVESGR
jgi:hypothetical protein